VSTVLSRILPHDVATAEAFGTLPDPSPSPEEAASLGQAVDKRRVEFATGRTLARRALLQLGVPPAPILRGSKREPLWPAGVVGSITHCRDYSAAAVAASAVVAAIGVDAEPHAPLPRGVLELVTIADERQWIRSRDGDGVCWDRVLFSAKESVYKSWFPTTRRWLGFADVHLTIDPDAGTFAARLVTERLTIVRSVLASLPGRFLVHGEHVLTAVVIAAPPVDQRNPIDQAPITG